MWLLRVLLDFSTCGYRMNHFGLVWSKYGLKDVKVWDVETTRKMFKLKTWQKCWNKKVFGMFMIEWMMLSLPPRLAKKDFKVILPMLTWCYWKKLINAKLLHKTLAMDWRWVVEIEDENSGGPFGRQEYQTIS